MNPFRLLFSCQGRIGRLTYFYLTCVMLLIQLGALVLVLNAGLKLSDISLRDGLAGGALFFGVFGWINFSISTKRFHDFGRSGWTAIILSLAPMLGGGLDLDLLASGNLAVLSATWLAEAALGLYASWLLSLLVFKDGDPGANAYGPAPGSDDAIEARGHKLAGDETCQARAFAAIDALAHGAPEGLGTHGSGGLRSPSVAARAQRAVAGFGRRNGAVRR